MSGQSGDKRIAMAQEPAARPLAPECVLGPFVGVRYVVRCPCCEILNDLRCDDGPALRRAALRRATLLKYCSAGHPLLVRIDAPPCAFERVCFADDEFRQEDEAPSELPGFDDRDADEAPSELPTIDDHDADEAPSELPRIDDDEFRQEDEAPSEVSTCKLHFP